MFRYKILEIIDPFYDFYLSKKFNIEENVRPMIKAVKKNHENDSLVGLEIGVARGLNAFNMLNVLNIEKLYLVDPYEPYIEKGKEFYRGYSKKSMLRRMKPFGNKIIFIQKSSYDAADHITEKLDFVYIDGDHSYDLVKKDLEKYYPKLMIGGFFGGHDYSPDYPEVIKAIDEFINKFDLKLFREERDWWVIKK